MDQPTRLSDPSGGPQPGTCGFWLGGSFAGRIIEFKLRLSRTKAKDTDDDRAHPAAEQKPWPVCSDLEHTDPLQVPFPQYAGWKPQIIRNVPSNGAQPSRVSVSEKAMANFWDSLNPDQRRAFEAKANKRVFPSGARLMREGEQGDHVAVLLSGLTEIRVSEDGAERVIAERGPGQLIGERAALEVSPRSATVVAIQTVVALVVRTEDFAAFISTYPAVLRIVENQIYYRLREGTARYDAGPIRAGDLADSWPDRWTAPDRDGRRYPENAALRSSLLAGQNCTVIRTDVAAFGANHRDDNARRIIRRAVSVMTQSALGPLWDICRREDRGDGKLLIVPPDIPTTQVTDRLVTMLPAELRRHNRTYSAAIAVQLRVAVEVGPIEEDEDGVSGKSIIDVSRMLDAPAFKRAISTEGSVLGVIVSPFIYDSAIKHGGGALDSAMFCEVPVEVKETRTTAWMHLAGRAGQDGQVQLATSGASSPCSRV